MRSVSRYHEKNPYVIDVMGVEHRVDYEPGECSTRLFGGNFQNHVLFYEHFHGDNGFGIGASHQAGWTGLVAKLIQQSGQ